MALTDFYLVRFEEVRAWNAPEVRRLSPAVQQSGSLLAMEAAADGNFGWGECFLVGMDRTECPKTGARKWSLPHWRR